MSNRTPSIFVEEFSRLEALCKQVLLLLPKAIEHATNTGETPFALQLTKVYNEIYTALED